MLKMPSTPFLLEHVFLFSMDLPLECLRESSLSLQTELLKLSPTLWNCCSELRHPCVNVEGVKRSEKGMQRQLVTSQTPLQSSTKTAQEMNRFLSFLLNGLLTLEPLANLLLKSLLAMESFSLCLREESF